MTNITESPLPTHARIVIIGGGAVGASCAYHIAKMGCSDVVLLEKNELTSGSSWHAAGNCPRFSGSWTIMKMQAYSIDLFHKLSDEVDYPMNYHVTGSIRLAHSKERMQEFEHVVSMANYQNLELSMMSNQEMKDIYPFLETHDIVGGCYDPLDGDIDPAQLTQAFAKGARQYGAKIVRFCPVTNISRKNDEWHVETEKGTIICEKIVNAAGYRAHEIGKMLGRDLPCVSLAHQYLITEEIEDLKNYEKKLPLLRDPDSSYYLRQEKHGLLLGPYEKNCKAHWITDNDPMPDDFSFQLYDDDLERLEWYIEDACARVPILGTAGITRVVNGPIPYAPDGNPLIGPMPGIPNAYEACVFTFGIVQSGGAGHLLAQWVLNGETEWDGWAVDPRRFTGFCDNDYAIKKAIEIYSHEYAMHFPHYEWPDARDKKLSPLHQRLEELGAQFGARAGWERAVYFGDKDKDYPQENNETYHRHGQWFAHMRNEALAVHKHVSICDMPGFTRYNIIGHDVSGWLHTLITGKIPKAGRIGLVYFASDNGKVLTEMTIAHFGTNDLGQEHMQLISAASAQWHDLDWLQQHLPTNSDITITDNSDDMSTLVIAGPKSRSLLSKAFNDDEFFNHDKLKWMQHRSLKFQHHDILVMRVSYVGELGYEIHAKNEQMLAIFDMIWQHHDVFNARMFGMYAMNSLRIEKNYRAWKQDLSTDYSLFEAGLDRFVTLYKDTDFIGKTALLKEKQQGIALQTVTIICDDDECDAPYLAPVSVDGHYVGLVTSAAYGFRTGKSLAIATIATKYAQENQPVKIDIFGRKVQGNVTRHIVYDADNSRLKM